MGVVGGNQTNGTGNGTAPPPRPRGPFEQFWDRITPDDPAAFFGDALLFVAVIVTGLLLGKLLRAGHRVFARGVPTSGQPLFGKMLSFLAVLVALLVGLAGVFRIDLISVFATLGIVSLALGFGLQNTVANMAGGVGLTLDKPFDVGDRIRVEDTWGDVVNIGLRSTRILTTSGEHVVIPNSILDKQEVWNYTHHGEGRLRVEIPVGISYDSSLELAENLALRAARSAPGALPYPDPEVVYQSFGDSSVNFELRFWIARAQDRVRVKNEVIRGIKRRFDEGGVTIPFPQRTVGDLKDRPKPAPTPEHLMGDAITRPVVLVVEGGSVGPAMADAAVEVAAELEARLVVLHVRPPQLAMHRAGAAETVNMYLQRARAKEVPASGRSEVGDAKVVLEKTIREIGAKLVLVENTHRFRLGASINRAEFVSLQKKSIALLALLDPANPPSADVLDNWRRHVRPHEYEKEEEENGDAEREAAKGRRPAGEGEAGGDDEATDEGGPETGA